MAGVVLCLAVALRGEPIAATESIKGALSRAGAVITAAQRLGNQALVVSFELNAENAGALHAELRGVAQMLDESDAKLDRAALDLAPDTELSGTLHVTLVHDAADERVELPKVPG
jgi:hypothetical protein